MLSKFETLYERDETGKLIPQEVKLELTRQDELDYPELKNQTVLIIPLTRGEIKKVFSNLLVEDKKTDSNSVTDNDGDVIVGHCMEPKYSSEDIKFVKPVIVRSILRTILTESGVKMSDESGSKKFEDNDEFGKN